MELRWIPGDPRINPARRGGGRGASRGWKGMRPGVPRRGPDLGVRPSPARPPTAACKRPKRLGKRGVVESHTPRLLGLLRAGSRGGESGVFAVLTVLKGEKRHSVRCPQNPFIIH